MKQMDISQVQMVRSAKGVDMLCVDDYLYHFIDRGNKRCRWVCNKLKSKHVSCRSRIATVILNGDESRHKVVRVTNEHTHDRCTQREISKVVERKLQADLAKKPSTLRCKYDKCKASSKKSHQADSTDENENKNNSVAHKWDEGEESDEWPADEDDLFSEQNKVAVQPMGSHSPTTGGSNFFHAKKQQLYMLKTALGRQMLCVEGFLYRLESKSITSTTHRWECIKQDPQCKDRILTECLSNGTHRLKEHQVMKHCHEGYTPFKLGKLLIKNNIRILAEDGRECKDFQTIKSLKSVNNVDPIGRPVASKPPKKRIMESLNSFVKEEETLTDTRIEAKRMRTRTKAQPVTYLYAEDPLEALSTSSKTDLDKTKFTFLPSAKGHKVLCLDNYIFHLDTRSPRNGRAYWTCLLRRDKFYKCNARVTTEMTNKGPIIVRVSGKHFHSDHSEDIKRRLRRSFVAKSAEEAGISVENVLNESGNGLLNKEFKEIVEKAKDVIERSIGQAKNRVEDDKAASTSHQPIKIDENTCSSFSSCLESDDDLMNATPALPTKLEEMCKNDENKGAIVTEEVATTSRKVKEQNDSVIEEITGEEMEVEYLDVNALGDEENAIEIAKTDENDHLDTTTVVADQNKLFDRSLTIDSEMNLDNVSTLRSAKGGELLCVDGYIYHIKSTINNRKYWSCIKSKDPELNCRSRVATISVNNENRVFRTTNQHTHPVIESDIKRRLYNEIKNDAIDSDKIYQVSFDAINTKFSKILGKEETDLKKGLENFETEIDDAIGMTMKLYAVSDGPPSLAVRMVLKVLNISYELIDIDFIAGEHMTEQYAKMNPQKEIPVLDDDGFQLSESIAIMQYLCDKYAPNNQLYPKDATKRAIVNQRLCFNMGFYYAAISAHSMAPIFFDYQRTETSLKKVQNALNVFETYLRKSGTKYAATNCLTIADFALVTATLCLEAIGFDLSPYALIKKWYETFKSENAELWAIGYKGMQEIAQFEKNPPDLSHMNHPFHPTRKTKV